MKLLNSGGALSLEIDCCRLARPIAIFCHLALKKCILTLFRPGFFTI